MTTTNSRVMHMAHLLHRSRPDFAWSDMLRHAWYFVRFRQWLHEGLVTFTYLKLDNSIRDARGTLNEHLIPKDDLPKGTGTAAVNYAVVKYYDIDRKGWREFDIRRFVGYVERFPLKEKRTKRENYAERL